MGRPAPFTRHRRLGRAVLALSTTAAVLGAVGPLSGTAAADDGSGEAVLAPVTRTISPGYLYSAGTSGFVHAEASVPGSVEWTSYATGQTTAYPLPSDLGSVLDTASDSIAYTTVSGVSVDAVHLIDPADGTTRTWTVPDGSTFAAVRGDTLLVTHSGECHLLQLGDDGSDRLVTGLPRGAACTSTTMSGTGSADEAAVQYTLFDGSRVWGVVDFGTAHLSPLPLALPTVPHNLRLTADYVSWYDLVTKSVELVPRSDLRATPRAVPLDWQYSVDTFLVGDRVVWVNGGGGVLSAIAPDGSSSTLLPSAYDRAVAGPDGSLLIIGRDSANNYAVQRFTGGSDGAPVRATVLPVPWLDTRSTRLALSHGDLMSYETDPYGAGFGFASRQLTLSGTPATTERGSLGESRTTLGDPACTDECTGPAMYATSDGRSAVYTQISAGSVPEIVQLGPDSTTYALVHGALSLSVEGVSGHYAALAVTNDIETYTEIYDLDDMSFVAEAPAGAVALWGDTLWRAASGKLIASDVVTGKVLRTLDTGADCTVSRLQASARQLYWECGGAAPTAAGVVDVATGATRSVATLATTGLLGDGYVARLDADRHVVVTDVTGGGAADRVLGAAISSVPGVGWTVDPYGDDVAYADADHAVHVVRTGVPTTPLAQLGSTVPATVTAGGTATPWQWSLSKPASSWTLALKNQATGTTVRTLTGEEARATVSATWDGKTAGGAFAPNGTYTWTLTVQPADGQGAALVKTGTVKLLHGAAVPRDFGGPAETPDGVGDLFTLNPSGGLTYQEGNGTGKFASKTTGTGWPTTATVIPFDDMGADRCNDVLVRMPTGELRRYAPGCGKPVSVTTNHSSLGTGWNAYDMLTSPGDLTGDGRADLLARKVSTHDIYLFADDGSGHLAHGIKIRTGWGPRLMVGTGDINGDGIGDIIVQDHSGGLWRYEGRGDGTLKDKVKIFTGWGLGYNTIVGVGDITGDDHPDIVERDSAGNLFRNNGNGKGSFSSRTQIATGYKGYVALF